MTDTGVIVALVALIVVFGLIAWADREQPPSAPEESDDPQVIDEDEL